jgi:hypothetical protein
VEEEAAKLQWVMGNDQGKSVNRACIVARLEELLQPQKLVAFFE